MAPGPARAERFAADLDRVAEQGAKLGVAVSGGPDSLALLLLAAEARPGFVEAATVDHGLRPESAGEANAVGQICTEIGIPHTTLRIEWDKSPGANIQSLSREARYAALERWAVAAGVNAVATAHHLDDQAETVLMRLARGAGVAGLGGIKGSRPLGEHGVRLIRPLLGWRRTDLRAVVEDAGLTPVDDPSNGDDRFDRTRARSLLAGSSWINAERLAASAAIIREADEALDWIAVHKFASRHRLDGEALFLDAEDLPPELQRRLLLMAIRSMCGEVPPGPKVSDALAVLRRGGMTTLAGLKLEGGAMWRLTNAPPRRR